MIDYLKNGIMYFFKLIFCCLILFTSINAYPEDEIIFYPPDLSEISAHEFSEWHLRKEGLDSSEYLLEDLIYSYRARRWYITYVNKNEQKKSYIEIKMSDEYPCAYVIEHRQ